VVFQCPCGADAIRRSPRGARPRVRVMLVLVQVSSRKISCAGSSRGCASRQRWRASAMSARACSAAWMRRPHQPPADRNAVRLAQPGTQFIQGGVLTKAHMLRDGVMKIRQQPGCLRPLRMDCRVTIPEIPPPGLHDIGNADTKASRHRARGIIGGKNPVPQILRISLPLRQTMTCLRIEPETYES
jgi:hypothetical protein